MPDRDNYIQIAKGRAHQECPFCGRTLDYWGYCPDDACNRKNPQGGEEDFALD